MPLKHTTRTPSGALHPGVLLLLWGGLTIGLEFFLPLPAPQIPYAQILSKVLAVLGIVLILWSWIELARHGTTTEHGRPTTELVTSGPYRFSRNPIYVGLIGIMLSVGLDYEAPWALIFAAAVALAFHFLTVRREEEYLEREFGDAYVEYRRSVRRWV